LGDQHGLHGTSVEAKVVMSRILPARDSATTPMRCRNELMQQSHEVYEARNGAVCHRLEDSSGDAIIRKLASQLVAVIHLD
jgi:hypothetical protein